MKELPMSSVDLVITSPPYFNVREYKGGEEGIGRPDDTLATWKNDMLTVLKECERVLAPGRLCVWNIGDIVSDEKRIPLGAILIMLGMEAGLEFRENIIWMKPEGASTSSRYGLFIQHPYPRYYNPNCITEYIIVFAKRGARVRTYAEKTKIDITKIPVDMKCDVWKINPVSNREDFNNEGVHHPAMFPMEIPKRLITVYSHPGETVLDPFLGSGTTMRMALELKRNCIGYEISEEYIEQFIKPKLGTDIMRLDGTKIEIIKRA